ncbi:MAG: hypothetical protein JWO71_1300 [Candidatus Acidoferrum typicum]|nr:hypothetical protein [Candidatus Acidoferrum typicum]
MGTLRITVFGLLAVAAVLAVVTIHLWREGARKKEGLNALREMTPDRLIANCGQPSSDKESMSIALDMKTGTVTVTDGSAKSAGLASARSIEYRPPQSPYWVKFEFARDISNQLQPIRWHLTHFASPSVGVSPSDENAYIAIPVFPCMAKRPPYSSP